MTTTTTGAAQSTAPAGILPFPDAESAFMPRHVPPGRWRAAQLAGNRRMCAARRQDPTEPPPWVDAFALRAHGQRLAQARKTADGGTWLFCGNEQKSGIVMWLLARMPLDALPGYSPKRQAEAVRFWQSWQNPVTGRFYDPAKTDPANPDDPDAFCNEKYVIGILRAAT